MIGAHPSRQILRAEERKQRKVSCHELTLADRVDRRNLYLGIDLQDRRMRDFVAANQYPEVKRTEHHTLSHTVYRKVTNALGIVVGFEVDHVNTPKTYTPNGKREVARRLRQLQRLMEKVRDFFEGFENLTLEAYQKEALHALQYGDQCPKPLTSGSGKVRKPHKTPTSTSSTD